MRPEKIPPEIQDFVVSSITSVEGLEVLLLLEAGKEQWWTAQSVDQVIRSTLASIENRLIDLHRLGLLSCDDGPPMRYRYAPSSPDLLRLSIRLLETYRTRRTEVIELIYSRSKREIRMFADAFRIKGDKERE